MRNFGNPLEPELNRPVVHWNTDYDIHRLPSQAYITWMAAVHSLHEGDQRVAPPDRLAERAKRSLAYIKAGLSHLESLGMITCNAFDEWLIPPHIAFIGPATATPPASPAAPDPGASHR